MNNRGWHWRNTPRTVMLGPIDAKALFPFVGCIFWHSWILFGIAVVITAFLSVARYFGWSATTLLLYIRSKIAGRRVARRKVFKFKTLD